MITARMTQAVMAPRLWTRGVSATGVAGPVEQLADHGRQAAGMTGIDVDDDAHADPELRLPREIGEVHDHRDALHDLDPVAGRVLRREHREAGARSRADAADHAFPLDTGIGIDGDGD